MSDKDDRVMRKRHSLAHLLGAALVALYPDTKLAIGPPIDDGFYYDAEVPIPLSADDLPTIEKKMREIVKTWSTFEKKAVSKEDARAHFKDNPYKRELIEDIAKEGGEITLYQSGDFIDLCGGGHVNDMKEVSLDGFTLSSIAGAYWRGDEKNTMLTRIYGLAFDSKKELDEYKAMLEAAKERDHRKIGKELGLFSFSPLVGSGLPLFTPKGMALRSALESVLSQLLDTYGYEKVWIPHIAKPDLYKTSGHWEKFEDELFKVRGKTEEFVMKPMNCPHHTQIYASTPKSHHDLPVRYAEFTTVYRDEQKGELLGLSRVLSITQDDGHIFCTEDQIAEEVTQTVALIIEFYTALGFFKEDDCEVFLSVRGDDKARYLGADKTWDRAETVLAEALQQAKLSFTTEKGEAAFYGPKIDFHFRDSLGRKRQLATVQLDFVMPERFKLVYTDSDGKKKTPVMIHRAISGSLERFLGIMIEHFAGKFPFFLCPVQVAVLPIGTEEHPYAQEVAQELRNAGLRTTIDKRDESIGKKIARVHTEKIPARVVIGKKEVAEKTVTLETEEGKQVLSIEECMRVLREKNKMFKTRH
ncbi:MAG: threonine--tRNA ligase [Candidatus Kaiserbacteria bacterium]|nr:threonine--tRNA ligase [Candidatus Kaiserbacteria bacterium]